MSKTWYDEVRDLEKLLNKCEHYIDEFLDKVDAVMERTVEEVKKQCKYEKIIMMNMKQLADTYYNLFHAKEVANELKDIILKGLLEMR